MSAPKSALTWLLLVLWLSACRTPVVEEDAAVRRAEQCALDSGYRLANYTMASTDVEGPEICVFFVGKDRRPGHHFTVCVNKRTGKCRIIEGR